MKCKKELFLENDVCHFLSLAALGKTSMSTCQDVFNGLTDHCSLHDQYLFVAVFVARIFERQPVMDVLINTHANVR